MKKFNNLLFLLFIKRGFLIKKHYSNSLFNYLTIKKTDLYNKSIIKFINNSKLVKINNYNLEIEGMFENQILAKIKFVNERQNNEKSNQEISLL